jgi:hypothetical protein
MELKMSVCIEVIAILTSFIAYLVLRHMAGSDIQGIEEKEVDTGLQGKWKLLCYTVLAVATFLHLVSLVMEHVL